MLGKERLDARDWLRDDSAGQEMTREWLARRLARADALMARLWPAAASD